MVGIANQGRNQAHPVLRTFELRGADGLVSPAENTSGRRYCEVSMVVSQVVQNPMRPLCVVWFDVPAGWALPSMDRPDARDSVRIATSALYRCHPSIFMGYRNNNLAYGWFLDTTRLPLGERY